MSADFEVYPCTEINFSFGDLLAEFNKNIKDFFLRNDIHIDFNVSAGIYNSKTEREKIIPDSMPFRRPEENETIWIGYDFSVCGKMIADLTHIYFYPFENDECITSDYVFDRKQQMISNIEERMPYIMNAGGFFSFHGRAWPAYGFAAAAFAKLTDGVIFSEFGAWSYSKLPCLADDFVRFYFNICDSSNDENDIFEAKWYFKNIKTYDYVINGKIQTYNNVKYNIYNLDFVKLFLDMNYDIKPSPYDLNSYTKYAEINGNTTSLHFFDKYLPMKIDSIIDAANQSKNISSICIIDDSFLFLDERYIERIKLKLYTLTKGSKKYRRRLQTVYLVAGEKIFVFK